MSDGRVNNGGARPGSGRKPLVTDEALEKVRQLVAQHSAEIDETDLQKRERILVLMDVLYENGKKGNIHAVKEYLDRQTGKAKESIDLTSKGKSLQPVLVKFMSDDKGTEDNRNTTGVQETV